MKMCSKCGYARPLEDFNKNQRYCRDHQKQWYADNAEKHKKNVADRKLRVRGEKYGLSPEEHDALRLSNGGLCHLCRTRVAEHIDHDHATGRVRGHLCQPCNTGLGKLGDTVESLERALAYLRGE